MNNFWKDKRVFCTGIAGFLGANLDAYLQALGAKVCGLVRDETERVRVLSRESEAVLVRGDIRDRNLVNRIISEYNPEIVFHLAAQPIVQVAQKNPVNTIDINVMGTANVLDAIRLYGDKVKSIVCASSDKSYGDVPAEKFPS